MTDNILPEYEEDPYGAEVDKEEAKNASGNQKVNQLSGVHATGFKDFLLKSELQKAIVDCGFEHPSDVQQECITHSMIGVDVLCQAKSGLGKTAVFVLTILHQLEIEPKPVTALILAHARELAYQINNEFKRFTKHMPTVRTHVLYGGEPYSEHVKLLKSDKAPHIVVGTPGRILQLAKKKDIDFSNLKFFVLDECDRMLEEIDMRTDVQQIYKFTPHKKQVMMFSATMQEETKNICRKFMVNQFEIFIDQEKKLTLHGLLQYYIELEENQKLKKLVDLLDKLMFNQVIIFVKKVEYAQKLDEYLNKENFPSTCIHRRMSQAERIKRYTDFKQFKKRIMVATDIFGRGIDIEKVNVVFNYDMSIDSDSYLHRVGRAGRFGTKGLAITFISSPEDKTVLEDVQKRFEVKIGAMPETIDQNAYMNN